MMLLLCMLSRCDVFDESMGGSRALPPPRLPFCLLLSGTGSKPGCWRSEPALGVTALAKLFGLVGCLRQLIQVEEGQIGEWQFGKQVICWNWWCAVQIQQACLLAVPCISSVCGIVAALPSQKAPTIRAQSAVAVHLAPANKTIRSHIVARAPLGPEALHMQRASACSLIASEKEAFGPRLCTTHAARPNAFGGNSPYQPSQGIASTCASSSAHSCSCKIAGTWLTRVHAFQHDGGVQAGVLAQAWGARPAG